MGLEPTALLAATIDECVAPHRFKRIEPTPSSPTLSWVAAWKRKTWNTNRGIALIALPEGTGPAGDYALDVRAAVGKEIGYIPFLYELGLQLILCGTDVLKRGDGLDRYVTKINNSTVLLQSIHLVDLQGAGHRSVRTWGQVITGPFIDAIESALSRYSTSPPGKI
jgi:hypothetical protein